MQYLFLDESGNLHKNSPDKYFVIGGVFTNNYADIKKSYVEINHDLKEKPGAFTPGFYLLFGGD